MGGPGMHDADDHAGAADPADRRGLAIITPANTALVLGALAIVCTLLWAMHEDAQRELQRERIEQQAQAQPSAEQRRHMAAQFVCGHGVAYQWVNGDTVECLRELDPQVMTGR